MIREARLSGCGVRGVVGALVLAMAALLSMPAQAELPGGIAGSAEGLETVGGPAGEASAQGLDALLEGAAAAVASVLAAGAKLDVAPATEIDRGKGSWYGGRFHGRRTASGEKFNMHELTAAHKTLPFGTRVTVRDLATGREVEVRINDRGPHVRGRIIDLSRAAALALGILHAGEAAVALLLP